MLEIRASALARPMNCAGFLFFKDLPPEEENDAAKEGTAAAEYLEGLLTGKTLGSHATNGVFFDSDIKFYIGEIAARLWSDSNGTIECEKEVRFQGRNWRVEGRFDASYVRGDTLYIVDLKYGWGIVDPVRNWQLIAYALGELNRRQCAVNRITMLIEQPRPYHEDGPTRSWTVSLDQLKELYSEIDVRLTSIAVQGDRTLTTGNHCKYCPAMMSCPAANKMFWNTIDETFKEWRQDDISNEALAKQIDLLMRAKEVLKIREQSITALANYRIRSGNIVPGYAVEPKYGHRKWNQNVTPTTLEMLTGKDITENVLMSPAKAEKLGLPKDLIEKFTSRPMIKQDLVAVDAEKLAQKYFKEGK